MPRFLVEHREVLVTTYLIDAKDEEDAFEAIQSGDGEEMDRDIEPMPYGDDSEWAAEEV